MVTLQESIEIKNVKKREQLQIGRFTAKGKVKWRICEQTLKEKR